jgi:hypothetical protein
MTRPVASLSLDLDNHWSYLKTRGDDRWQGMPSYLDLVVPRFLDMHRRLGLPLTVFVVGADAEREENRAALRMIADAGCEIANHSFHHEPWLHLYSPAEVAAEIVNAERAIAEATGKRPIGFRGPGFSISEEVLRTLSERGYAYDASTFPTIISPLARLYYFVRTRLSRAEQKTRGRLFGRITDGFRPLRPYAWSIGDRTLTELPVTTMPLLRLPIHLTYLQYLAGYAPGLAKAYFVTALTLCKAFGIAPSFLLHPLDFLGKDEAYGLDFFPAMNQPADAKLAFAEWALAALAQRFEVVTMAEHAARAARKVTRTTVPDFGVQAT